jgi:hypothetical protein
VLFPLSAVVALSIVTAVPASQTSFGPDSARVTNAWYPLKPGATYIYRGVKDGKPARDYYTVSHAVATIGGVRCAVVHDRLYLAGRLEERTTDWYAQDTAGNVWYYGESTAVLDTAGKVTSTEGSWQAGRDGARAGIFMPARPRVGLSLRQEFYKGHAEDRFRVLGRSKRLLLTQEWTPLEPGVLDHKLYRRGIGTVREESVRGPVERLVLVRFRAARA